MKGQIFLIIAIMTVTTLLLLRTSLSITRVIEDKRSLEMSLERLEFDNTRNELIRTVDYSYNQSQNISDNVGDYLKFVRNSFSSRLMDLDSLAISSIFPTVSTDSETRLNVTILNLLGREIDFMNLTFSSHNISITYNNFLHEYTYDTNFTFTTSSIVNYTLTVFYNTTVGNSTESIIIPVEIGKSKYVGFFDIKLVGSRQEQRDKITKTMELP